MKMCFPQFERERAFTLLHEVAVIVLLVGLVACYSPKVLALSGFQQQGTPSEDATATPNTGDQVAARAAAAQAAREGGDAVAIAGANRQLIAAAAHELAQLRVLQADYVKAVEAYRLSLQLEDAPATRLDLAAAELQAGKLDDAVQLAEQVHAGDPHNLRADRVLASAYVQKGEYLRAVEPFTVVAKAEPAVDNLYPLAVCLLETKTAANKQKAEAVFERMRKTAGDSGSLHVLIGRAYRDADDMPSAVAAFQKAIAIDDRTPHAHYFLGLARLFMNDWKPTPEAEAELRKEAQYFPQDYLANYMLGFLTSGERNYEESNKYLDAASKIDPTAPEPFLYLGLNAYAQEDLPRAEKMLRQAVVLTGADEARSNYQIRRAYVDLGRILSSSGRTEEGDVFITKARELQNKTMVQSQQSVANLAQAAGASSAAAVVQMSGKQEIDAAGDAAKSAGKLSAGERTALASRAEVLEQTLGLAYNDLATSEAIRGDYGQGLKDYQQAEHWDNKLPGLAKNLGQCAFRAKEYSEAIRGLSQALAMQPASNALRAMLGVSYFATDDYADAARTFAPLGVPGMEDSATGYPWAASLTHLGEMKKATDVLTTFEAQARSNETMLLVGQLWTQIGDYVRARATLQRALASDPSLPTAHFYLGMADIHAEQWADAAREFQAELSRSPRDPDAQYHLGFVDLQQAKTDEAMKLFLSVIADHPDYANAQYQVGKVLLDRGQVDDAVGHLEAAAKLSPDADYMHYQLQAAYRKENRAADADRELAIYKELKAKSRERAADAVKFNP